MDVNLPRTESAVPVLQVADVERSLNWYTAVLGFRADPFPDRPPYSFAMLHRNVAEIMLQCAATKPDHSPADSARRNTGWSIYLRMSGGKLLEFAESVRQQTPLLRGPERMFYGQVEFEIADPDGHRICVAEALPASANVAKRKD